MAVWPSPRHALPPLLAFMGGAALLALAAAEVLDLHERGGRWLWEHGVEAPGPIAHVDDLIVVAYAVCATVAVLAALPALMRRRTSIIRLAACGAALATAVALDVLGNPGSRTEILEEALEVIGAIGLALVLGGEAMREQAWRDTDPLDPSGVKAAT